MENNEAAELEEIVQKKSGRPSAGNKKPRRYLTAKEYRFYKFMLERFKEGSGESDKSLAVKSGYSEKTPVTVIKDQISRVLSGNEQLQQKLNAAGLGLDSLVDDFEELRKCKNDKGTPDNATRFKVLALRTEVMNAKPPKRVQIDERKQVINITPQVLDAIRKVKGEEEMRRLLEE